MTDEYEEARAIIHTAAELIKTSPDPQHAMGRATERAAIVAFAWKYSLGKYPSFEGLIAAIERGDHAQPEPAQQRGGE